MSINFNSDSELSTFVGATTRKDGYVNATKWCAKYGYDLSNWKKSPQTKAKVKAFLAHSKYYGVKPWIVSRIGRTSETWVHPIMAIHLASYLDAEFANHVAGVFQRYLEGDANLAIEIIDRNNNPEDLKRIEKRIKTKQTNKSVNSAIQAAGGTCFAAVANINNLGVTGLTAKELQLARNVKQTRDGMTSLELSAISIAEEAEAHSIKAKGIRGDVAIISTCQEIANDVAAFVRKYA
jgi:hypothetical protein